MKIKIAGIERNSIVDGDGLRYVIFTQGCNHRCKGCHNPETWDFNGGTEVGTDELLKEIKEDPLIDGVTLSGGDPLFQADKLIDFVKQIRDAGLNIWIYTGFIFDEFLKYEKNETADKRINNSMIELLKLSDVVVDGPFKIDKRTLELKFRGSKNQRLIDSKKSFKNNKIYEWRT